MQFSWMHLPDGLHLNINGRPVMVAKDSPHYEAVAKAIKDKLGPDAVLEILEAEKRALEEAIELTPDLRFNGGTLLYKGEPVAGLIGERMLAQLREGFDLTPSIKFLENLMQNPSKRVVDQLYDFLEKGKCTFTEDGCFLAYKAIRSDWKDIHSGRFDNSIGQVVEMPRNKVDEDPNRTCSQGLHVCSFDYLPYFAHSDGHVVVCKVNPRDVVAIPNDYNNTKMRVCRYEVIGEVTDYYKRGEDKLAAASVAADRPFEVLADYGDGSLVHVDAFDLLSDASAAFEDLVENGDVEAVHLVNRKTGVTLHVQDGIGRGGYDDSDEDDEDEDDYFEVVGIAADGREEVLADEFETVAEAVAWALDAVEDWPTIEVRDANGHRVRSITS